MTVSTIYASKLEGEQGLYAIKNSNLLINFEDHKQQTVIHSSFQRSKRHMLNTYSGGIKLTTYWCFLAEQLFGIQRRRTTDGHRPYISILCPSVRRNYRHQRRVVAFGLLNQTSEDPRGYYSMWGTNRVRGFLWKIIAQTNGRNRTVEKEWDLCRNSPS